MRMCHREGYSFPTVKKSESFGLEYGATYQESENGMKIEFLENSKSGIG